MNSRIFAWVCGVMLLATAAAVNGAVTTDSLLDEMTNLERLAVLPSPAYVTRQFSSYDPKSKTPQDHEGWFANRDRGQYIRTEKVGNRTEYVMMDTEGPGAIVRIWSANPDGDLRIYIDGAAKPAIEGSMSDLMGGQVGSLPEPIAGVRARGYNLYLPIPYAKHCKVTCTDKALYYQVNYRTYAAGTVVQSFAPSDLQRLSGKIGEIAGALRKPAQAAKPPPQCAAEHFNAALKPGDSAVLAELTGPQRIYELRTKLSASDVTAAARGVVLSITFDGEKTVECPLGDFFGTAPGLNLYESLPLGITQGQSPGMYCRWVMPFAKSAKVAVTNLGRQPVELNGSLVFSSHTWTDATLHFHAKWRIERDLPARPFSDWTHLQCAGEGRFVGTTLSVINPVRRWWGEGDEKIYVDGETFPSHFGTGSEDYFGYAWCNNVPFTHAYHNQPRVDGPGNFGHTSNNRFHVIDDIPFAQSFRFDMENWHSQEDAKTTRASVSYWYARPGGTDTFKPLTADDVTPPATMQYKIAHVPGAIEGESLAEITVPGNCRVIDVDDRCSGEQYLWWEQGKPGDKLVLGFEATSAGPRQVIVRLVGARTYGRVQLYVNDDKSGEPVDLRKERVRALPEMDLGSHELTKGRNRLTVEMLGADEQAGAKCEFGIDYLLIK